MAEIAHKEVLEGLKRLYADKIRPVELATFYQQFYSSPLADAEFDAPPMVLLVGPYSVGKTSFIKYLVGKDFPGSR
jgi:EH domain-containing protein 1